MSELPIEVRQSARIVRSLSVELRELRRRIAKYRGGKWLCVRIHLERIHADLAGEHRQAVCLVRGYLRDAERLSLCSEYDLAFLRWSLSERPHLGASLPSCPVCCRAPKGAERNRIYCGRRCRSALRHRSRKTRRPK